MNTISQLAKQVANGDKKSFSKLYELTSKSVWYTCICLLKNESNAKDMMQDIYMTAYAKLPEMKDFENVQGWLNRIAANKCKNFLKSKSFSIEVENDSEAIPEVPDEDFLPDDYVYNAEKRKIVLNIIESTLSDVQYQTIIMFYFDEMTVEEIAETMECSKNTVVYRLGAARAKIKEGVLKYENKNDDKLHAMMPVPFLTKFFVEEAKNVKVCPINLNPIINDIPPKMSAPSIAATTEIGGKTMLNSIKIKIIAGIITSLVVVGGVTAVIVLNSKGDDDSNISTSSSEVSAVTTPTDNSTNGDVTTTNVVDVKEEKATDVKYFEYKELVDGTCEITKFSVSCPDTDIVIPSQINGKPVSRLKGNMFMKAEKVKSIVIPNTVRYMNTICYECSALESLTIPDSVVCINWKPIQAYNNKKCTIYIKKDGWLDKESQERKNDLLGLGHDIQAIDMVAAEPYNYDNDATKFQYTVLDDGTLEITEYLGYVENAEVPAEIDGKKVTSIGVRAIAGCYYLKSLKLPDTITNIGEGAFNNSIKLESVNIPKNVTKIGKGAFECCYELKSAMVIPESATDLGESLFNKCNKLESVTLPSTITEIKKNMFCETALKSINIPNTVTKIGDNAFKSTGISELKLPSGLKEIGSGCFRLCGSLKSVVIPAGITEMKNYVFYECRGMESITIPATVTKIDEFALGMMNKLVVYGKSGSAAEQFAKKNNIKFSVK